MSDEAEYACEVRDLAMAWLEDHRRTCRGRHCVEPLNLLAFFAHCLGVRSTALGQLRDQLAAYEATCPDCQHLRN